MSHTHRTTEPYIVVEFAGIDRENETTTHWFTLDGASMEDCYTIDGETFGLRQVGGWGETGETTLVDEDGRPVAESTEKEVITNCLRSTEGEWVSYIIESSAGVMPVCGGFIAYDTVDEYETARNQN